jgi:O-antigen/teichoic acid export membrane protein
MPADRYRPLLILLLAALAVMMSLAVCAAAILVPAPPAAVPLVALMCVGCPVFASWDVPLALASLRGQRGNHALAMLRKSLDQLPEVEHPLGY